jgi:hypothetical protein
MDPAPRTAARRNKGAAMGDADFSAMAVLMNSITPSGKTAQREEKNRRSEINTD